MRVSAAALLLAAVAACGPHQTGTAPGVKLAEPPRVLVLPFGVGGSLAPSGAFVRWRTAAAMPEDLGTTAAEVLAAALAKDGIAVVDARVGPEAAQDAASAARAAERVGANLAVLGAVLRYVEREGTALAAQSPASVAYQVALVRVPDGTVVATDQFDYTQQPLTANLLDLPRFVQGGGRWMTRREILEGALGETAHRLAAAIRRDRGVAPGGASR
jgi:curli biogenesis system outer membrane secretion channel CsgG